MLVSPSFSPPPHISVPWSMPASMDPEAIMYPDHTFYIGIQAIYLPMIPMKKCLIVILLALLAMPVSVSALVTYSGSSVNIIDPVADDVFVTGGMIEVNAPVRSLTAAGGTITINAPVSEDVIAAGGTIIINGDVGGKVVAVGGSIDLAGNITTNAVLQGGTVTVRNSATIGKDAMISAGSVRNAGTVLGTLSVQSQSVENTGHAGTVIVKKTQGTGISAVWLFSVLAVLLSLGWFIIGLLLIRIIPIRFFQVEQEVRIDTLLKFVVGFAAIIIAFLACILLAITVVLLPLALILGGMVFIGLLLASLFVASALGRVIGGYLKWNGKDWQLYTAGFLALVILFLIPIINILAFVISFSLGFGAILSAVRKNWGAITGSATS
jgi:hypothetical protein